MVKKMQESDTENEIREAYRVCNFSSFFNVFITTIEIIHTNYSGNYASKMWGHLWFVGSNGNNLKKIYPENMKKKIVGAVWELPAKYHGQYSPFPLKLGWIGCAI